MACSGRRNLYCEATFYDLLFLAVRVMCFKTVFMPNKPPFNSVLLAFIFTRLLLIRVSFKCFFQTFFSIYQSLFGLKTFQSNLTQKVYLFWNKSWGVLCWRKMSRAFELICYFCRISLLTYSNKITKCINGRQLEKNAKHNLNILPSPLRLSF